VPTTAVGTLRHTFLSLTSALKIQAMLTLQQLN
jgi:hypothetical protein